MKRRSKRKSQSEAPWVTYSRCFLLTLGLLFVGLSAWGLLDADDRDSWPAWLQPVMIGMLILGLLVLAVAFFGSRKDAESWANAGSQHEASIILLIIAAPLYFTLKPFDRTSRRKRS
jgi:hypothetical protein